MGTRGNQFLTYLEINVRTRWRIKSWASGSTLPRPKPADLYLDLDPDLDLDLDLRAWWLP